MTDEYMNTHLYITTYHKRNERIYGLVFSFVLPFLDQLQIFEICVKNKILETSFLNKFCLKV